MLDDNPAVVCSLEDPVWRTQLVLSAIVGISFVLGFPLWIYYRISVARAEKARYNDPRFQMVFRWLLLRYSGNPRHCRFEIFILVRKVCVSAAQLMTTNYPGLGIAICAVVIGWSLYMTASRLPYRCQACMIEMNMPFFERVYQPNTDQQADEKKKERRGRD